MLMYPHREAADGEDTAFVAAIPDVEKLRRFVMRARRVQSHSLVRDWEGLQAHVRGDLSGQMNLNGQMTLVRQLPADEEVFESLAARLRPLTLETESVHYPAVLDVVKRVLGSSGEHDDLRQRADQLRAAWEAAELKGTQTQAYAVQWGRTDGSGATPLVSDTQLAAAWLYADLVHTDAKGPKAEGLAFSLQERYAAAVRLFSHLAVLTVAALELVEALRDRGLGDLPNAAWEEEVVVGKTELTQQVQMFVAPVGGEIPDLRTSQALPTEWRPFGVTDLLRQDPQNRVSVVFTKEGGASVETYEALISRRHRDDGWVELEILAAGSTLYLFRLNLDAEDRVESITLESERMLLDSNETQLSACRFALDAYRSRSVAFTTASSLTWTVTLPSRTPAEEAQMHIRAEVLQDLTAMESHLGQRLPAWDGRASTRERVQLRHARLIWDGEVIASFRDPVKIHAAIGVVPRVIATPAGVVTVGSVEVPTLAQLTRHPEMTVEEIESAADVEPNVTTFLVTPPVGKALLTWAPERVSIEEDDQLVATEELRLTGVGGTANPA